VATLLSVIEIDLTQSLHLFKDIVLWSLLADIFHVLEYSLDDLVVLIKSLLSQGNVHLESRERPEFMILSTTKLESPSLVDQIAQ
jgi:hypothetical protein